MATEDVIDQMYFNIEAGLADRCNSNGDKNRPYKSRFTMRMRDGPAVDFMGPFRLWEDVVTPAYRSSRLRQLVAKPRSNLYQVMMYNYLLFGSKIKVRHEHRYLKVKRSALNKKVIKGKLWRF